MDTAPAAIFGRAGRPGRFGVAPIALIVNVGNSTLWRSSSTRAVRPALRTSHRDFLDRARRWRAGSPLWPAADHACRQSSVIHGHGALGARRAPVPLEFDAPCAWSSAFACCAAPACRPISPYRTATRCWAAVLACCAPAADVVPEWQDAHLRAPAQAGKQTGPLW